MILAGELSLAPGKQLDEVDYDRIVRSVVRNIGYTKDLDIGFDSLNCKITSHIGRQSRDIGRGIKKKKQGAGDQGIIFGYACDETKAWMPAPIHYAHELMRRHERVRRNEGKGVLRPDAKSQVTFYYDEHGHPAAVKTVVLSTQHKEGVPQKKLKELCAGTNHRTGHPSGVARRKIQGAD